MLKDMTAAARVVAHVARHGYTITSLTLDDDTDGYITAVNDVYGIRITSAAAGHTLTAATRSDGTTVATYFLSRDNGRHNRTMFEAFLTEFDQEAF